jgi:hypothetical protein
LHNLIRSSKREPRTLLTQKRERARQRDAPNPVVNRGCTVTDTPDRPDEASEEPSLRQRLHSATGDREAEARVLAKEADVPEEEANHAVREAAGDEDEPAAKGDIARPADVEAAHRADSD